MDLDRVMTLVGEELPSDPAEVERLLSVAIRRIDDERKRYDRKASLLPATEVALAEVEHDVMVRSSPALRDLESRGEQLRLRVHQARAKVDGIVVNIAHWREVQLSSERDISSSDQEPSSVEAVVRLRSVQVMQTMLEEHQQLRVVTDRIGRNG